MVKVSVVIITLNEEKNLSRCLTSVAGIADGLKEGEQVIVEGVQRARPNAPVTPAPVSSLASRS